MCVQFLQQPDVFPLFRQRLDSNTERIGFTPILAKRVEMVRRQHVSHSYQSLQFPMRSFSWDRNAVYGDHDRCLHLAPNSRVAQGLSGYGDHTLVVMPGTYYWSSGDSSRGWCHHANGVFNLFCVECEGYYPQEVSIPDFWRTEIPRGLRLAIQDASQHGAYVAKLDVRRRQ